MTTFQLTPKLPTQLLLPKLPTHNARLVHGARLVIVTVVFAMALTATFNARAQAAWHDGQEQLYLDAQARAFFGDEHGQPFVDSEGYVFVVDDTGNRYYLHPDQTVHHHVWDSHGNAIAVFRDVQTYHINLTSGNGRYFTSPTGSLYTTTDDTRFLLDDQGMPYQSGDAYYVLDELGKRFFLAEDGQPYKDSQGQYLVDTQGDNHYLTGND
jgi:hypothetical protein